MAISVVRSTGLQIANGVTSDSGDFSALPASGNTILVLVGGYQSTPQSQNWTCSDNQSNTYTLDVNQNYSTDSACAIFRATNIGSPSGTFTVTVNFQAAAYQHWVAIEVSGLTNTTPLDVSDGNTGSTHLSDASAGPTSATSQNDELAVAVLGATSADTNANVVTPSGYTQLAVVQNFATIAGYESSYKILSATGAQTAQWDHDQDGGAGNWVAAIACYKAAAGGASAVQSLMQISG